MAQNPKDASGLSRPQARVAKGFRDIEAAEIRQQQDMLARIRAVYERYGFEPLETPTIEYTDALGKFLPDSDRPNEGVFSFQEVAPEAREDNKAEQWLSLRYDLTAPLARYVAENQTRLPKPFRRYATGSVYRNEKPGPGRFRQFTQFDADTVGSDSIAADAEMCMLAADTLEALGIKRGDYVIKVSSRRVLDGIMEANELGGPENAARRLIVLRAIDKLDRLGDDGVRLLLGEGRTDQSGDRTVGAGLAPEANASIRMAISPGATYSLKPETGTFVVSSGEATMRLDSGQRSENALYIQNRKQYFPDTANYQAGLDELVRMAEIFEIAGYQADRIRMDISVVRGLEYYTGPVFEAELTFEVKDDDGNPVRFGSVGGGGRYDDLVARFTGEKVPATGFSIGVSRLQSALNVIGAKTAAAAGPVVVLVMDKPRLADYQRLTQSLRDAGIRAEMYLGSAGMKAQMKYADKRGAPIAVIQGSDEAANGEVTLKDLVEGAKAAAAIKDNKEWKDTRPAQISVPETKFVDAVKEILARHSS